MTSSSSSTLAARVRQVGAVLAACGDQYGEDSGDALALGFVLGATFAVDDPELAWAYVSAYRDLLDGETRAILDDLVARAQARP